MRALLNNLRHWQERRDCPAYWVWVREYGSRLGDHVHILAAAPSGSGRELSNTLRRWLRGSSIRGDLPRGTLNTRPTTARGWLVYVAKTMTPADAAKLSVETGIRFYSEPPGGVVNGARVGIARCLGPKAQMTGAATMTEPCAEVRLGCLQINLGPVLLGGHGRCGTRRLL